MNDSSAPQTPRNKKQADKQARFDAAKADAIENSKKHLMNRELEARAAGKRSKIVHTILVKDHKTVECKTDVKEESIASISSSSAAASDTSTNIVSEYYLSLSFLFLAILNFSMNFSLAS